MKLRDYLAKNDEGPTAFAQRADLSRSTVQRVLRGRWPGRIAVEKIVAATGGKVSPADIGAGVVVGAD